jgi:hypothetical protein
MRRREFLTFLGVAGTIVSEAARAQQAIRRIGVLLPASSADSKVKGDLVAFARRLQSLG